MRLAVLSAVVAVGSIALAAYGQNNRAEVDRFRLYTGCKPMDLVIEDLNDDTKGIGLTRDRIRVTIESRLRSARLYRSDPGPSYLYVNVIGSSRVFSISLEFKKRLYDRLTDLTSYATTWHTGGAGSHGDNARIIPSHLSELVDEFLVEYLRVNGSACGSP